jgi:hypothetical protein
MRFSELAGIKYPTFALWVQKRRRARAVTEGAPLQEEVEAGVKPGREPIRLFEAVAEWSGRDRAEPALRIELPGGALMLVESAGQLRLGAELLRLLAVKGERGC